MKIRDLMTKNPEACLAMDSCKTAGEIMARRNCGFVPIVDNPHCRRVVGVVTDRDIAMALLGTNRPGSQVRLEECMTRDPKMILPDAELKEAARLMESAAVHRLPVVEDGALVGVLALKDIAAYASQAEGFTGKDIAQREVAEIVEAISIAR
ncbi:MAG: CBS domain-containing protein [Candidatus Omnitrophica bacterium]|nr:CBS domain-containing protein [Candidatus Omnitrophota bacterium]